MNKKSFIKLQLKSMLPFASLTAAFLAIITWMGCLNASSYTGFYSMGYLIILFASISPISIFSYRTSLKEQEFYRQSPISKNKLALIRMLIMVVLFALAIILATITGALGTTIRLADNKLYFGSYDNFKFWEFLILDTFYIIAAGVQIVISCFIANTCNTKKTISVASCYGAILLTFTYFALVLILADCFYWHGAENYIYFFPSGLGLVKVGNTIISMESLITSLFGGSLEFNIVFVLCTNIIVPLGLAGGAVYYFFKNNEPSAEYSGKVASRSIIPDVAFHGTHALLFFVFAYIFNPFSMDAFPLTVLLLAAYYFTNASRTKSMKISNKDLIFMLSCSFGAMLISLLISGFNPLL